MRTLLPFNATALAEIVGCYLPWLWSKHDESTYGGIRPTLWDWAGSAVASAGMAIISSQPQQVSP